MFNRDFFRYIPPVTRNLLIINIAIFGICLFLPAGIENTVYERFAIHYFESPLFRPYQLLTAMFMHAGIGHLFFNMFALLMFGFSVEYAMNSKRFLLFYMVCGIGAGLIQELVWYITMPWVIDSSLPGYINALAAQNGVSVQTMHDALNAENLAIVKRNIMSLFSCVGASGAIYGVLLAYGMIFPNRILQMIFPPVALKAKWVVLGYGILELVLALGSLTGNIGDGVAHFAHLGGMIFGLIMILYWKHKHTLNGYY